MYLHINNAGDIHYPATGEYLAEAYPSTSFPQELEYANLQDFGVYPVVLTIPPNTDPKVERLVEDVPVYLNGVWQQNWKKIPLDQDQLSSLAQVLAQDTRQKRLRLLQNSDWTQVLDAPVDQSAWASYRQALRDVTTQPGFPHDVTWPTQPE